MMKDLKDKDLIEINGGAAGDAAEAIGVLAGLQMVLIAPQLWFAKKLYDYL